MLRFVVVLLSARASNTWGATAPQPIEEGTALAPTEGDTELVGAHTKARALRLMLIRRDELGLR